MFYIKTVWDIFMAVIIWCGYLWILLVTDLILHIHVFRDYYRSSILQMGLQEVFFSITNFLI